MYSKVMRMPLVLQFGYDEITRALDKREYLVIIRDNFR